jgi:hypothetical protein
MLVMWMCVFKTSWDLVVCLFISYVVCDIVMIVLIVYHGFMSHLSHLCRLPTNFCKYLWLSSQVYILV